MRGIDPKEETIKNTTCTKLSCSFSVETLESLFGQIS